MTPPTSADRQTNPAGRSRTPPKEEAEPSANGEANCERLEARGGAGAAAAGAGAAGAAA